MLFGVAIADDCLLHQSRRVFVNVNRGPRGGQQGDTAHLAQLQRDLDVGLEKTVFNGTGIGAVTCD